MYRDGAGIADAVGFESDGMCVVASHGVTPGRSHLPSVPAPVGRAVLAEALLADDVLAADTRLWYTVASFDVSPARSTRFE